jgi:hypothetical protein
VELDPVVHHRVADEVETAVGQMEQDRVADDEALVVHGDVLLGLAGGEVGEAVHGQSLEQRERVRAAEEQVGHVMGLIE